MISPLIRVPSPAGAPAGHPTSWSRKVPRGSAKSTNASLCGDVFPSHEDISVAAKRVIEKLSRNLLSELRRRPEVEESTNARFALRGPHWSALDGHMSHHCDFAEASCISGSSMMPATSLLSPRSLR
ncbi:hypothetical protein AXF42_Ash000117 [Apostasia shenzhenica]|uniref:Uncharacterized protein n=1 Tax=Apostasia shenzhenica TaxID=1088818 RepID=A0A2I0AFF2_9ASPA|nr:hypothetical protein AXF42_Ash000117 [Apostasia shenzhenica]